jgi:hypothetical protein
MPRLPLIAAGLSCVVVTACGGGAGSQTTPAAALSTGATSSASAPIKAATFTVTVPVSSTASGTSSTARSLQYVSPATTVFYISLQDSPGIGDPTYSFTENVDSTHCTHPTEYSDVCTYTEQVPLGTDLFSIVAASGGSSSEPLSYAGVLNSANSGGGPISATITAAGPNAISADLAPVVASAPGTYQFITLSLYAAPNLPYFNVAFHDAGGDDAPAPGNGNESNSTLVAPVTVSDTTPFYCGYRNVHAVWRIHDTTGNIIRGNRRRIVLRRLKRFYGNANNNGCRSGGASFADRILTTADADIEHTGMVAILRHHVRDANRPNGQPMHVRYRARGVHHHRSPTNDTRVTSPMASSRALRRPWFSHERFSEYGGSV